MIIQIFLRTLIAGYLLLTFSMGWALAEEAIYRNPSPDRTWGKKIGGWFTSGKSVGVVIGISKYIGDAAGGYRQLDTAQDAERMKDFLIHDAGFDTVYLLTEENATKEKIDRLMMDEIPTAVGKYDRFLFYWSGHGDQRITSDDAKTKIGFLPLANSKRGEFSSMISMNRLWEWDYNLSSLQALFVLDACLSGLAGTQPKGEVLQDLALPAHYLMTAGTDKERAIAADRWNGSLFTDSFILGAKGQAPRYSGIINLYSLMGFLKNRVSVETSAAHWTHTLAPQLKMLRGGDGTFFFIPSGAREEHAKLEPTVETSIQPKGVAQKPSELDWVLHDGDRDMCTFRRKVRGTTDILLHFRKSAQYRPRLEAEILLPKDEYTLTGMEHNSGCKKYVDVQGTFQLGPLTRKVSKQVPHRDCPSKGLVYGLISTTQSEGVVPTGYVGATLLQANTEKEIRDYVGHLSSAKSASFTPTAGPKSGQTITIPLEGLHPLMSTIKCPAVNIGAYLPAR